jgi:pimeloyl-ACP methyl ester carboxylesterase/DNA-binding CsgD family transcriptional regulator
VEPVIRYARTSDGIKIAYYGIGSGPPLIYLTPKSHLEREWQYPEQRAWLQELAQRHRVFRFDRRCIGLSDSVGEFGVDELLIDVEALVKEEGLGRFALVARVSSASTAILYANKHQEQVSHLVLFCPYIHNQELLQNSGPHQAVRATAAIDWGTFTQTLAELTTGWTDMEQARRYAAYLRQCSKASGHDGFFERFTEDDLAHELSELTIPVLVLQRTDTVFPTVEDARRIAAKPPLGHLVLLEGAAAVPFLGDTDAVFSSIFTFLSEPSERRPDGLTERELEILALLARGASNAGMASELSISTRTVDRHIANVYRKIGTHNRAEATAYAFRQGIAKVA